MPKVTVYNKVGATESLDFQLTADKIPINLAGCSVEIRLKFDDNTTVDYNTDRDTDRLKITDVSDGKVRFLPLSTTFSSIDKSADMFFWVTDAAKRITAFPRIDFVRISVTEVW